MINNNYFWQGGRKIAIEHTERGITLQAPNIEAAKAEASKARVSLENMAQVSSNLVRATAGTDRNGLMAQLRQSGTKEVKSPINLGF